MSVEKKVGPVKLTLIDNYANWWRRWSTWVIGLVTVSSLMLVGIHKMTPEDQLLIPHWFKVIAAICSVIGGPAALALAQIKQNLPPPPPPQKEEEDDNEHA